MKSPSVDISVLVGDKSNAPKPWPSLVHIRVSHKESLLFS